MQYFQNDHNTRGGLRVFVLFCSFSKLGLLSPCCWRKQEIDENIRMLKLGGIIPRLVKTNQRC